MVSSRLDLRGNGVVDSDHDLASLQRGDLWHGHRADRWNGGAVGDGAGLLSVVCSCTATHRTSHAALPHTSP